MQLVKNAEENFNLNFLYTSYLKYICNSYICSIFLAILATEYN